MRFKENLQSVVLLISSVYILYLGANGSLGLYIHPRYIAFTLIMSVAALLLVSFHSTNLKQHKSNSHSGTLISIAPLCLILLFAVLLPARSLTSATVSQRSTDAGSIVNSSTKSGLFSGSSRGLKLADWSQLLSTKTDPSYYINKPAKISGFLYDAKLGEDTVWLARFVLTCCAVDVQPIGVPVKLEGWNNQYNEDEWLEIEGEFMVQNTSNGEELVLVPTNVSKIEQPKNPYAN